MRMLDAVDYVPPAVTENVVVLGTSRAAVPPADAAASWNDLASTGSSIALPLFAGGGALVVVLGLVLLLLSRRPSRTH